MNNVIRKAALLAAVSALAPAAASAAEFSFAGGNSNGYIGNVRTFNADDGTQVEVTAYSMDGSSLSAGSVGAYSPGLGVFSSFCTPGWFGCYGGDTSHTVDNSGRIDILVLQFDKDVTVNSLGIYGFGDTDFTYGVGSTDTLFSDALSIGSKSAFEGLFSPYSQSSAGSSNSLVSRSVNGVGDTGNLFFVSASMVKSDWWDKSDTSDDSFKLNGLSFTVAPPVPEPATWGMMMLGLGVVGFSMRRRKTAVSFA